MPHFNSKNIIKSVRMNDNIHQKIKKASEQLKVKESGLMLDAIESHCDKILMNKEMDIYKIIALESLKEIAFIKAYLLHLIIVYDVSIYY